MEFEIGTMVHYMNEDMDAFGVIEEIRENSYTVREYARAGEDFVPTDNIHEVTEVHDMYEYALTEMGKTAQTEPDPEQIKVLFSFVEYDTEDGKAKGIVKAINDETGTLTIEPITDTNEKTGFEIEAAPNDVDLIDDIEVTDKKHVAPKFIAKIKNAETSEGENDDGERIGIIDGYLSIFNNTDLGGDVVRKGAFTQTISHNSGRFKLQLDHGFFTRDVAGMFHAEEDEKGLKIRAEMPLHVGYVADAYNIVKFNLKRGVSMGLSIGYDIVNSVPNKSGGYDLTELKLYEGSITPFPMNTEAVVTDVKAKAQKYQPKPRAAQATSSEQDALALDTLIIQSITTLTQEITNV